jgi:uncharacterized membrane protein YbhN (UPF0104 family)
MAFVIFAQSLGPAIMLALCDVIFDASLRSELQSRVGHLDTEAIIRAGATGFRAIVPSVDLPEIVTAIADSVDRVFYLVAAVAAACALVLWGMGWQDLRRQDGGADVEGGKSAEKSGEPE